MKVERRLLFVFLAVFVVVAAILVFTSAAAKARTITVDDSGGRNYTTIQAAVNAANTGDTVYVYNGTYNEEVTISKRINLVGESNQSTIINGTGASYSKGIYVTASYVNINNLKVDTFCYGIYYLSSSNNIITSNMITNCIFGIVLYSNTNNNEISSNTITNTTHAIHIYSSKNNVVSFNTITNCSNGIVLSDSSNHTILTNTIMNIEGGIELYSSSNNSIATNTVSNCSYIGVYLSDSNNNAIMSNTLINASMAIFGDNVVSNNTINGKPVLYYKNIDTRQSPYILDNMNANGIILYNCSGFIIKYTMMEGGSIVLDSSSYISIVSNTIMNNGYGISTYSSSNNTIASNIIINSRGEGIVIGLSTNNTITSNTITNCRWGIYLDSSSNNNNVTSNTVANCGDVGICLYGSNNIIASNNIYDNKQGGMYSSGGSANTAYNNWWGDASGPYNTASNPTGTGDNITDGVPFSPWATSPFNISSTTPPQNHAPTITTISANRTTVYTSEKATITTTASDVDGDSLTYSYTATGGSISGTGSNVVLWTAPTTSGTYTITVRVSDGGATTTTTGSVNIVVSAAAPPSSSQKTITVCAAGGKNYTKIQIAVDAASTGDTVYVYNGVYQEGVILRDGVKLVGENNQKTIIKGTGADGTTGVTIPMGAKYANISNIKIDGFEYGIYLDGSNNNTIKSTTIVNTHTGILLFYEGIWPNYYDSSNNTITANTISNCSDQGIYVYEGQYNIIESNTIKNSHYGVYLFQNSDYNIIKSNNITGNVYGSGVRLENSSYNTINSNIIANCSGGIEFISNSSNNKANYNNIFGNTLCGLHSDGAGNNNTASSNWWGDASGPYNAASNPNGKGDNITDGIPFSSWMTSGVGQSHPDSQTQTQTTNQTGNQTSTDKNRTATNTTNATALFSLSSLGNLTILVPIIATAVIVIAAVAYTVKRRNKTKMPKTEAVASEDKNAQPGGEHAIEWSPPPAYEPVTVPCRRCLAPITITSPQRPITVTCPKCRTSSIVRK